MTTQANTIVIGSRVDPQFAERVREAARAEDRSLGSLIRRALQHELERVNTERPAA